VNPGDPEGFAFATQIAALAVESGWRVTGIMPMLNMGSWRTGVNITATADEFTSGAAVALVTELHALQFDAVKEPEPETGSPDHPRMYVFVGLRPLAIPNEVSEAIAAQR
jgi:hypothetical protein